MQPTSTSSTFWFPRSSVGTLSWTLQRPASIDRFRAVNGYINPPISGGQRVVVMSLLTASVGNSFAAGRRDY